MQAVARSKERLVDALEEVQPGLSQKRGLEVVHASLLDLSSEELAALVAGADAVVQCLGHNLTFRGLWLPPYLLVKTACERLTAAVAESGKPRAKFVLMGSDGAANPGGEDDPRSLGERALLAVMRALLPPVRDNEAAAAYMHGLGMKSGLEWTVLRPTDMKNGEAQPYTLYPKPVGGLFGDGIVTRATVAACMVDLITNRKLWKQHAGRFPVVHDVEAGAS